MPETSSIPGLRDLWRLTLGDPRVCVAVLDGPAVLDHPCLRGANVRRLRSYWLDDGADVEDGLVEHATHVCSVLFSPHDTDVLGLAPRCRGLSIAVQTGGMTDAYNVVRALDAARDAGAHIIHVAVVQPTQSGTAENLLERAVRTCLDEGILVVSPAGNDRGECWTMPSAIPGVLAVGAMKDDGQPFQLSNYGGILQSQGVLAPGENILGADSTNGGTWKQKGTSCAAPIVTGVAALLMSLQLRQGRKPSAAEVRQAILDTAIPCDPREVDEPERCLRGKLNIPGATEAILGSAPAHHAGPARRAPMSVSPSGEARSGDRARATRAPLIRPDNQASTSGTGRVVRASGPAAQILVPVSQVKKEHDASSVREPEAGPVAPRSVHSTGFPALLHQLGASLLVTTYQANKLMIVRSDGDGLNIRFRSFPRPMGLALAGDRLAIGTLQQIWEFRDLPAVAANLEPLGKHDGCFLPRCCHVTGNIHVHEMAWVGEELWLVNTRFSCLCTLDAAYSFVPRWRPPFISELAPDDRCHLNGMGLVEGWPRYATALGTADTTGGWRADKVRGGVLIDVPSNEIVTRGLSMPHSPRWYADRLWLLESGTGTIGVVEPGSGRYEPIAQTPGFTRGLDFAGRYAFVGLSQVRETAIFGGLPITKRLSEEERYCGVWVLDIVTGQSVEILRFEEGVQEILAVQVVPGRRFPDLLTEDTERIGESFVLPAGALSATSKPLGDPAPVSWPGFSRRLTAPVSPSGREEAQRSSRALISPAPPVRPDTRTSAVVTGRAVRASGMPVETEDPVSPAKKRLIYALGTIGYDFGTESRRDTFKQLMPPVEVGGTTVPANPYDPRQMSDYLARNPSEARSLVWTLHQEQTPVYALKPVGSFGHQVYETFRLLLAGQVDVSGSGASVERVSVPAERTERAIRLFSGQVVPVVKLRVPRGLYGWQVDDLIEDALAAAAPGLGSDQALRVRRALRGFLDRVYHDLKNPGDTSKDRALNFAATNAFQVTAAFAQAVAEGRQLKSIEVVKSPVCRLYSDCWDVKLKFFDPDHGQRAKRVCRLTVDVSDLMPVTLGEVRTWMTRD